MPTYQIKVQWMAPYPKESTYRAQGSSIAVAANKGLRLWRKDNAGKRVQKVKLEIEKLS